mmetsp:Transcript_27855/g.69839  ORF Transcript_27855/g.69839 Transcript_27855/m.69839 type:complete len:218 (+) Transcript_27855:370-1023(+)
MNDGSQPLVPSPREDWPSLPGINLTSSVFSVLLPYAHVMLCSSRNRNLSLTALKLFLQRSRSMRIFLYLFLSLFLLNISNSPSVSSMRSLCSISHSLIFTRATSHCNMRRRSSFFSTSRSDVAACASAVRSMNSRSLLNACEISANAAVTYLYHSGLLSSASSATHMIRTFPSSSGGHRFILDDAYRPPRAVQTGRCVCGAAGLTGQLPACAPQPGI